jgi:hypothetical protein
MGLPKNQSAEHMAEMVNVALKPEEAEFIDYLRKEFRYGNLRLEVFDGIPKVATRLCRKSKL